MDIFVYVIILIVAIVVIVLFFARALVIIRPFEKGLIERFGKFYAVVDPGLNLIIPFVDTVRKVDIREQVIDVPPQNVITKDNVVVTVDAIVYFFIVDPYKVIYNVANFEAAALKLAQTSLRNLIGDMELDQSLTSRDRINTELRHAIEDATNAWGVKISRVEIQRIDPPADIAEAMSRQMKAERTRRAQIIEAEGIRRSQVLKAEGIKQSAILQAEGEKQSIILRAEAEKQSTILKAEGEKASIEKIAEANSYREVAIAQGEAKALLNIFTAIHEGNPTKELITIRYLETLQKIADGRATKIFLPLEVTGILGGIAGMGEIFRETKTGWAGKVNEHILAPESDNSGGSKTESKPPKYNESHK